MVQQGLHALETRPGRSRFTVWLVLALVLVAAIIATGGLVAVLRSGNSTAGAQARARRPQATASVLGGPAAEASAETARTLLTSAPGLVVSSERHAMVVAAGAIARRDHAPLLLTTSRGNTALAAAALRTAVTDLHSGTVLAVGVPATTIAAELPGVTVTASARQLPVTAAPAPLPQVAILIHTGRSVRTPALAIAAAATAAAAGARVIDVSGYDPGSDPAAIIALAAARPLHLVAVGARFGPVSLLASRAAVAETGVQLPGGGQVLFPMRKIVALYGSPGTPALGALGQQDLAASISRARAAAAAYTALTKVPVVPAFEIIATVAQASAGPAGTYSYESSVASLRPWVAAATKAGMYVTLDLQPGRANLLTQAKRYRSLLKRPNVGLALDPEWNLQPGQLPLRQIGSVGIGEVNSVVTWLARLTARYRLPQKLLELHEFQLTMIQNLQRLDTRHGDLAIVINMDGQGAPTTKLQTWQAVVANAPKGVFFGWKDFYVKDTPMLGPAATIRHKPQPVLISYQ